MYTQAHCTYTLDEAYAKGTRFGKCIVPGMLIGGLISRIIGMDFLPYVFSSSFSRSNNFFSLSFIFLAGIPVLILHVLYTPEKLTIGHDVRIDDFLFPVLKVHNVPCL